MCSSKIWIRWFWVLDKYFLIKLSAQYEKHQVFFYFMCLIINLPGALFLTQEIPYVTFKIILDLLEHFHKFYEF